MDPNDGWIFCGFIGFFFLLLSLFLLVSFGFVEPALVILCADLFTNWLIRALRLLVFTLQFLKICPQALFAPLFMPQSYILTFHFHFFPLLYFPLLRAWPQSNNIQCIQSCSYYWYSRNWKYFLRSPQGCWKCDGKIQDFPEIFSFCVCGFQSSDT